MQRTFHQRSAFGIIAAGDHSQHNIMQPSSMQSSLEIAKPPLLRWLIPASDFHLGPA